MVREIGEFYEIIDLGWASRTLPHTLLLMLYYFISKLFICDSYPTMWWPIIGIKFHSILFYTKVQVDKDQEKAQSEKDSHSKNRDGKKLN